MLVFNGFETAKFILSITIHKLINSHCSGASCLQIQVLKPQQKVINVIL